MNYYTCGICGANLDPGETCECKKRERDDIKSVTPQRRMYDTTSSANCQEVYI